MNDHVRLQIPARLSLAALCGFAADQGCRVDRLRDGTYRLVPVTAPPKAPVVDLLGYRARRGDAT